MRGITIEARGLAKRQGDRIAVSSLSFTVRPCAVTGFLGPHGAGKSTTMRLILGVGRRCSRSCWPRSGRWRAATPWSRPPPTTRPGGDRPRGRRPGHLTERERDVLVEVAAGRSNAEITARLIVSEATGKTQVGRILAKLELRDPGAGRCVRQ
jgi:DNA-binding CsgD family transcriptional regulator